MNLNNQPQKTLKLANPRGFCAGVDRAIEIVNLALLLFKAPIYVRHEIVHNRYVVEDLRNRGVIFVNELSEVPNNNLVIFSAHGVSQTVKLEVEQRHLKVLDATCPLVTKVHLEVLKYSTNGYNCILIGHHGHPEVEGTLGQFNYSFGNKIYLVENEKDVINLPNDLGKKIAYVTQTTLSVDDTYEVINTIKHRFPHAIGPKKNDICYATQNRQDAVRQLSLETDLVLVVGSNNSSNSTRLQELAQRCGTNAYLIDSITDIQPNWLADCQNIGVTAGASAPEHIVQNIVNFLRNQGFTNIIELEGQTENIHFNLPPELRISN